MSRIRNVVDLFCGCGGLSYGLEQAGFKTILGIDNWKDALLTFEENHPNARIINEDISDLNVEVIKKVIGKQKIDVIVGGPPCQGFSLSGARNFYDERNRLYLDFIRIVEVLKPKAFIIENVPGLASLFGGQVKDKIIQSFNSLGYQVSAQILNASDYGVPQNRKRIFFVGLKGKSTFKFPEPTHYYKNGKPLPGKEKLTVGEALSDLPLLRNEIGSEILKYSSSAKTSYQKMMRRNSKYLYNHVSTSHTKQTVEIVALVPEGGNYKLLPNHLKQTRNFHVAWTRLHRSKPSPTIDTGHRHHFHPTENRVPTVRESARIQSFPDTFRFLGSKTSQYKQVGNAVPPLLAKELGLELIKYL